MTRSDGLVLQSSKFEKRIASSNVSGYKLVRRGQLVYGFPLDEGVIAILHRFDVGAVSPIYNVWDVDTSRVDPMFLDALLRTPLLINEYRKRMSVTVDRRRIVSPTDFAAIETSIPCLNEQRAIAEVLTNVQRAKEAAAKVITATKELKKSLMCRVFTRNFVPTESTRCSEAAIPAAAKVAADWQEARLGDLARLSTGTTPSTAQPKYYGGGIPFVLTGEIANNRIRRTKQSISDCAILDCGLKLYGPGTVLVAMYGQGKTRGQVALLDISATITQNSAAIIASEVIDPEFLWLYLMSRYEWLRLEGKDGQISHLSLGYLRELRIPLPPVSVQRSIVDILTGVQCKLDAEEAYAFGLIAIFQSLLHNLMTGQLSAFSVSKG